MEYHLLSYTRLVLHKSLIWSPGFLFVPLLSASSPVPSPRRCAQSHAGLQIRGMRRRKAGRGLTDVLFRDRSLDAGLVGGKECCTRVLDRSMQELLREPCIETVLVCFFEVIAVLTDAVHAAKSAVKQKDQESGRGARDDRRKTSPHMTVVSMRVTRWRL